MLARLLINLAWISKSISKWISKYKDVWQDKDSKTGWRGGVGWGSGCPMSDDEAGRGGGLPQSHRSHKKYYFNWGT